MWKQSKFVRFIKILLIFNLLLILRLCMLQGILKIKQYPDTISIKCIILQLLKILNSFGKPQKKVYVSLNQSVF